MGWEGLLVPVEGDFGAFVGVGHFGCLENCSIGGVVV